MHCPPAKNSSQRLAAMAQRQAAGLLPHLQRLHQLGHAHLFEASLNHAGARSALLQLFQVHAVHELFGHAHQIGREKRLGNKILGGDQRAATSPRYHPGWPQR